MALLISQALVLHYIENFIPPLAPGAKLGLANIISLVALHLYGFREIAGLTLFNIQGSGSVYLTRYQQIPLKM